MKTLIINSGLLVLLLLPTLGFSNTKDADHAPIGHCYHWLNEGSSKFLTYKYNYAKANAGELTFYTTGGNGAVAGPGLYCAKTPGDSYSYGDRVIRIEFVEDIVMLDEKTGLNHCGKKGNYYPTQAECQSKPWDIKFYYGGGKGQLAWYVIRNPQAVASWSANSDQLAADLNAEKTFEPGGYSIHADNTVTLMNAEKAATGGAKTFQNPNARLSIVKILNDPSKLAQIPPLTVISLVQNYQGNDLPDSQKGAIYTTQFQRAFRDTKLTFADVLNVTKVSPVIQTAFLSEIKKLDVSNLGLVNPVLVLQTIDKFDGSIVMTDLKIRELWKNAILSPGDMNSLVETDLQKDGRVAKALDTSMPTKTELKAGLKSYNLISLIRIMNKYVDSGSGPVLQDSFKYLLRDLIVGGNSFADTFDKITNANLNKESALASVLVGDLLLAANMKTLDPITLGTALDRAEKGMDPTTLSNAQTKIMNLPISVDANKLTYQILEDIQEGKLALPKFYNETALMVKLLDRSIAERKVSKTPTNTFRMVMTGFFGYYNAKIRKERDPTKKTQLSQKASTDLLGLADNMNTAERAPFLYITVQNASYFKGNGRYENHPIDAFFAQYSKGDANFDQALENSLTTSLDGSILQFLIYNSEKSAEAKQLLSLYTQHVLDPNFDGILSDAEFLASQAEKKSWSNFVNTTHYSPWGNTRVPSTLCHAASVAIKYNDGISKAIDSKTAGDMKTWADDLNKGFCKTR